MAKALNEPADQVLATGVEPPSLSIGAAPVAVASDRGRNDAGALLRPREGYVWLFPATDTPRRATALAGRACIPHPGMEDNPGSLDGRNPQEVSEDTAFEAATLKESDVIHLEFYKQRRHLRSFDERLSTLLLKHPIAHRDGHFVWSRPNPPTRSCSVMNRIRPRLTEYQHLVEYVDCNPDFGRLCIVVSASVFAADEKGSVAVIERLFLSLKNECTRRLCVRIVGDGLRRELTAYVTWYNGHRPHTALDDRVPDDVYFDRCTADTINPYDKCDPGHIVCQSTEPSDHSTRRRSLSCPSPGSCRRHLHVQGAPDQPLLGQVSSHRPLLRIQKETRRLRATAQSRQFTIKSRSYPGLKGTPGTISRRSCSSSSPFLP